MSTHTIGSVSDVALTDFSAGASTGFEAGNGLERLRSRNHQDDEPAEQAAFPRADGGAPAWAFLTAAFFIEALIWGKIVKKHNLGFN